jgi:hypothetical protein
MREPCSIAPDFTTESTEITETDRKEERARIRIRNPFFPASVASVPSVVRLRIAPAAVKKAPHPSPDGLGEIEPTAPVRPGFAVGVAYTA